jgi:hypothetical protein
MDHNLFLSPSLLSNLAPYPELPNLGENPSWPLEVDLP